MDIDKLIKQKFRIAPGDILPFRGRLHSSRATIHELFAELGYTLGAEIGVHSGSHARHMLRVIPKLKLLLIDPWVAYENSSAESMEGRFQRCKRRLRNKNVVYIRKPSMEAVQEVKDLSLDFVYIDAMHDFDNAMMDYIVWSPKVKIGGIVSGHDYANSGRLGVFKAVEAYTFSHNIHDYYATGRIRHATEYPSFFWVKK
jgi:hypothetical protein